MSKLKTNRGAAKRFKRTASGRFKHAQGYKRHILTKKSSKRKRQLRATAIVAKADTPALQQLLPYH